MQIVKIAHSAKLGRAPGDQAPPHQGGPRLSQRARDTCNGIVDDRCFNPSYTPDVDKHCMQNDKASSSSYSNSEFHDICNSQSGNALTTAFSDCSFYNT